MATGTITAVIAETTAAIIVETTTETIQIMEGKIKEIKNIIRNSIKINCILKALSSKIIYEKKTEMNPANTIVIIKVERAKIIITTTIPVI